MYWPLYATAGKPSSLAALPGDLLIEIALSLDTISDVLNLAVTNRHIFSRVCSVLYRSVVLDTVKQCETTLSMLGRCPDVTRHVRSLVVRPDTDSRGASDLPSMIVSAAVRQLAASKRLEALTRFTWDADEHPYHDDMWFALRMGCPQLRYIGTSLGKRLPVSASHLMDFVDLNGFALTLRPAFYSTHVIAYTPDFDDDKTAEQNILPCLWDMLVHHSPRLEELSIQGTSPIPAKVAPIANSCWPHLRTLTLGSVSVDHGPFFHMANHPLAAFLRAHSNISTLNLYESSIPNTALAKLGSASPHLTSFTGTLAQLQAWSHAHQFMRAVALRAPLPTREVFPHVLSTVFHRMPHLESLVISLALHSPYDATVSLRALTTACPQLRHLELACTGSVSFRLETFAKAVRAFPRLRSLHLTIVKHPSDDSLSNGASSIALSNPRLSSFTVAFIPLELDPHAFSFSSTHSPDRLPFPLSIPSLIPSYFFVPEKLIGTFTLACDSHGLPLSLAGCERWSRRNWWRPWCSSSGSTMKRKWVRNLREPRGCAGLGEVCRLLLESSAAGAEMRMILACIVLACFAAWLGWISLRVENHATKGPASLPVATVSS